MLIISLLHFTLLPAPVLPVETVSSSGEAQVADAKEGLLSVIGRCKESRLTGRAVHSPAEKCRKGASRERVSAGE